MTNGENTATVCVPNSHLLRFPLSIDCFYLSLPIKSGINLAVTVKHPSEKRVSSPYVENRFPGLYQTVSTFHLTLPVFYRYRLSIWIGLHSTDYLWFEFPWHLLVFRSSRCTHHRTEIRLL